MSDSKLGDHVGTIGMGALAISAVTMYLLYNQQVVSERVAGIALALGVALVCAILLFNAAIDSAKTGADRGVAAGFAVLTFACISGLALLAVAPGEPVAHGTLRAAGESLPLPEQLHGPVRVLVHGDLPGDDSADVRFQLTGTAQPLEGHLVRKVTTSRTRKGGTARSTSALESEYLNGEIKDAHAIALASVTGVMRGPLSVAVYPNYLPVGAAYVMVAALVALCAALGVKRKWKDSAAPAVGLGAVFGLMVLANGTPDALIRPEVGALLVSPFIGGVGGVVMVWIMRRILRPRAITAPVATAG